MKVDDLLLEMADACQLAYRDEAPAGWLRRSLPGSLASRVVVADKGKTELICFRGTATIHEWVLDADYVQVDFEGETSHETGSPIQVHAGFYRDYLSMREQLLRLRGRGRNFVLAGHSLGGALATLLALDLSALKPLVVTFGCPRVGDYPFAAEWVFRGLQPRTWRVYNTRDVVPHLPPERIADPVHLRIDHYSHVGQPVPVHFAGQGGGVFGPSHAIGNYLEALLAKQEAA